MQELYKKFIKKSEVRVKVSRRNIKIIAIRKGPLSELDFNDGYRRYKNLLLYLKGFRFRHLKLGPSYIFKLLLANLDIKDNKNRNRRYLTNLKPGWDYRTLTFTIALTVYNQSYFELERAIKSALNQKRRPDVIAVHDDGSTNLQTLRALKKLLAENPSIKFTKSKNMGVVQSRNHLISRCRTSHLLFLDPDDELLPEYLEAAEELFLTDRTIEVVYPDVIVRNRKEQNLWITGPFDAIVLLHVNTIPMSSVCSTKMLIEFCGYSPKFEKGFEDWDLWVRAALSGAQGAHLRIPGYYYNKKLVSRTNEAELYKEKLSEEIQSRAFGKINNYPANSIGKINVFIIAPWFIRGGGVDVLLERLLQHFSKQKVALVTTEIVPLEYKSLITYELKQIIPVVEKQSFKTEDGFLRNLQALASEGAVIINLSSPWAFNNALRLRNLAKLHFAFAFNDIGTRRIIDCRDSLTEVWPVYEALNSELRKVKNKNISTEVIYVGVQQIKRARKTQISRRKLIVGWIGRLSPEKDPQKFIDTSKLLNSKEFAFSMAGEGPLQRKVLMDLKHHTNLKYLGFVESSKKYLEELDILVLTSKIEGIPLVAMEALQNGVYVIAPRIGGIPDLIIDKQNGLLYNGTKKDLLRKLIEARGIILSGESKPRLNEKFLEKAMLNHIDSRIKHYRQMS